MNELVKRNEPLMLSPQEKECWLAFSERVVRSFETNELEVSLLDLIFKTHFDCGQKLDERDAVLQAKSLAQDVKNYFCTLTLTELKIAFKRGILKEYGEYFGLNIATYLNWLKQYMSSNARIDLKRKFSDSKKTVAPILTDEQKKQIVLDGVHKCFSQFIETGVVYDFGNATYNYLDKLGIIPFTVARKAEIKKTVKERLVQEAKERSVKSRAEKTSLQSVLHGLMSESSTQKEVLIFECKREALLIYFKELLEMGITINDVLEK